MYRHGQRKKAGEGKMEAHWGNGLIGHRGRGEGGTDLVTSANVLRRLAATVLVHT